MSRLLINAGNTRCVAARLPDDAAAGGIVRLAEVATPRSAAAARRLTSRLAAMRQPDEPAAAASVVPLVSDALVRDLADLHLVDHTWDFPFAATIRHPRTVGADRWCNVAAAAAAGMTDALVIDAGTATTIDVLADGVFVGGLIAPGMAFAARRLQEAAPQLWRVPFAACELRPGRDTEEALQIGAFHVGVRGVTGTVEALLVPRPHSAVVLTGGLGAFLARPGWRHDPDWTLRGLAALSARRGPA